MARVFLDSYALIAILLGNPTYRDVAIKSGVVGVSNLAEAYYILRTQHSVDVAEQAYSLVSMLVVEIPLSTIRSAMIFREEFNKKNRKQALSYADAIGYTYARENGLDFVTGDDAFKGLDGVRFIK